MSAVLTEAAIEVRGLHKTFGSTHALDGLDLEVRRGEVHGFLGPNGSGKSTTIRVLLGLLRKDAGTATLLGGDPWSEATRLHRRLAYVPGEVSLWPQLTGGEVIDLLGRIRGDLDSGRKRELLDRFELDPRKKSRAYSKGNRQKVALVAALSSNAELLILDEPTSGLDPLMEEVFQECIREVRAEGRTVLLSSHILAEVEALCDRVSIIRAGRTVQHGSLEELRHFTHTTVIAETVRPPDGLEGLAGVTAVERRDGRVRFDVTSNELDGAIAHLSQLGIRSLVSHPPTLEELFLSQYGDRVEAGVVTRFTGTWALVRLILRRDRVRLPVWLGALVGLTGYSVAAVQGLYDTPQAQVSYAATVGSSGATIAMTGPPTALDTAGGITVFEVEPTALIGVALMTIFLTLRHTRQDEEAGRTELLRAGALGRNADLAAVGLMQTGASLVVGFGISVTFLAAGLPAGGSLLFGASVTCLGLVFAGIALLAAQVTEHARSATGLAVTVLGLTYVARAVGDVNESWLSWLSPIGWAQKIGAFGDDERWWPLGLTVLLAAALAATAGWLTTRRDIGAGLLPPRLGSPAASPRLAGPFGLALRLQRGALLGWAAGVGLLGVAYGSLGQDVEDMISGNEELEEIFLQATGGASIVDAYFATVFMIQALLATGFTVSSALRLRAEEGALHAEPLLATRLSRTRWALSSLAVTALGTTIVLLAGGLGAGVTYSLISSDSSQVGELTLAMLTYLPATLALGGLAFALFGLAPRAAAAAWGVFVVCVVFGWLGELLSVPDWLLDLSPYGLTPQVPVADHDWLPLAAISAAAALMVVVGLVGLRRRDLVTE